ncbi:MAG: hypothetical protein N2200_05635 [Bacteroidia bacterium]|nr:hypothetical protein [Bacteroidia bacterium]
MHKCACLLIGVLFAQRIISRTQIEVKGYSVEKVGMPYALVPAGKGRFAYIEYWAQDKPKPGWYIECQNTDYYTQWSQMIDIPEAGKGRPLRLLSLKESLVLLSYEEDPLTRGVTQEVARFYDFKGQLLLPKWVSISTYDRPMNEARTGIIPSGDSTHFLWYAYEVNKKGTVERSLYAVWSQNGRKVSSSTDWGMRDIPLALALDHRLCIWTVERSPDRQTTIGCYDTRGRTNRRWKVSIDTVFYEPRLYPTSKGIYVAGLLPGEKNIPYKDGMRIGKWAIGFLPMPLTDTSAFHWTIAPFPEEWLSLYKEPTNFSAKEILSIADTAVYVLWEDIRSRGGAALAYDVWAVRWRKIGDSLAFHWAYRIEKRQKEPDMRMVSFLRGVGPTFITIAFLTERTGKGKLIAYQINHQTGEAVTKELATNAAGDMLLLPMEAAYLGPQEVICLALAPASKNGYQIYHIKL